MHINRRNLLASLAGASLISPTFSQTRNGTVVFPFSAGSGGDATSRLIAEKIQAATNTPYIVENRVGGNGRLGILSVKNASVESKTLLITTGPTMSIYPHFYANLGFDVIKDFTPISRLADFVFAVAVSKSAPVNTLQELKAYLQANPTKANYGTPSLGTFPHFFGLILGQKMGVKIEPIPYRGSAPVVQNLVGDQILMGISPLSDFLAQHEGKNLKVIAVLTDKRSPFAQDVPTAKEQGYDIVGDGWYGLWAPAGMPKAEQVALNKIVVEALKQQDTIDRLRKLGLVEHSSSPEELNATQIADLKQWAPIIDASGFKPND